MINVKLTHVFRLRFIWLLIFFFPCLENEVVVKLRIGEFIKIFFFFSFFPLLWKLSGGCNKSSLTLNKAADDFEFLCFFLKNINKVRPISFPFSVTFLRIFKIRRWTANVRFIPHPLSVKINELSTWAFAMGSCL